MYVVDSESLLLLVLFGAVREIRFECSICCEDGVEQCYVVFGNFQRWDNRTFFKVVPKGYRSIHDYKVTIDK